MQTVVKLKLLLRVYKLNVTLNFNTRDAVVCKIYYSTKSYFGKSMYMSKNFKHTFVSSPSFIDTLLI